nr:MAG TPA: hypothetical protein [Caudoviricetes sp.]
MQVNTRRNPYLYIPRKNFNYTSTKKLKKLRKTANFCHQTQPKNMQNTVQ